MAELSIIPVNTAEDLDRFVELPWSIYTPDSPWVPNLKKQDRELLSPGEHPFWKTARRELFLALRDGRPVGRIAAIVDEKYNAYAGERCGAFGFFECQDDREAAHALLQAAYAACTAQRPYGSYRPSRSGRRWIDGRCCL